MSEGFLVDLTPTEETEPLVKAVLVFLASPGGADHLCCSVFHAVNSPLECMEINLRPC